MADMNRKRIDRLRRIGLNFNTELDNIMKARFRNGRANPLDRKTNSSRRITEAIPKHKLWPQIKLDIVNADFNEIFKCK